MRVAFLHSDKSRERLLADAFLLGVRTHGHETASYALGQLEEPGDYDVAVMVGVKSKELFRAHHRAGKRVIYLDKGYSRAKSISPVRGWEYWRVSIDRHHPTSFLRVQSQPSDRWRKLGLRMAKWQKNRTGHIVLAGSSAKYHDFYGIKDPTAYMAQIVRAISRSEPNTPMLYRPKPSWHDAVPIEGTQFSPPTATIMDALEGARLLVTHGSNACFEAVLLGVPCIILGDAVAAPISSTVLGDLQKPRLAKEPEREQWASNLAYWQWTSEEFASGEAWEFLGRALHANV